MKVEMENRNPGSDRMTKNSDRSMTGQIFEYLNIYLLFISPSGSSNSLSTAAICTLTAFISRSALPRATTFRATGKICNSPGDFLNARS